MDQDVRYILGDGFHFKSDCVSVSPRSTTQPRQKTKGIRNKYQHLATASDTIG